MKIIRLTAIAALALAPQVSHGAEAFTNFLNQLDVDFQDAAAFAGTAATTEFVADVIGEDWIDPVTDEKAEYLKGLLKQRELARGAVGIVVDTTADQLKNLRPDKAASRGDAQPLSTDLVRNLALNTESRLIWAALCRGYTALNKQYKEKVGADNLPERKCEGFEKWVYKAWHKGGRTTVRIVLGETVHKKK